MSELHKFLFDGLPVRGMIVRLTDAWVEILKRRRAADAAEVWPWPVAEMLGEMAAAGALMQANALIQRFQGMDARLDGKRKLIFSLAQSLYLTPRSRAGVAPEEKDGEEPQSDMDKLLDEE